MAARFPPHRVGIVLLLAGIAAAASATWFTTRATLNAEIYDRGAVAPWWLASRWGALPYVAGLIAGGVLLDRGVRASRLVAAGGLAVAIALGLTVTGAGPATPLGVIALLARGIFAVAVFGAVARMFSHRVGCLLFGVATVEVALEFGAGISPFLQMVWPLSDRFIPNATLWARNWAAALFVLSLAAVFLRAPIDRAVREVRGAISPLGMGTVVGLGVLLSVWLSFVAASLPNAQTATGAPPATYWWLVWASAFWPIPALVVAAIVAKRTPARFSPAALLALIGAVAFVVPAIVSLGTEPYARDLLDRMSYLLAAVWLESAIIAAVLLIAPAGRVGVVLAVYLAGTWLLRLAIGNTMSALSHTTVLIGIGVLAVSFAIFAWRPTRRAGPDAD